VNDFLNGDSENVEWRLDIGLQRGGGGGGDDQAKLKEISCELEEAGDVKLGVIGSPKDILKYAVYVARDNAGKIIYVGMTSNPLRQGFEHAGRFSITVIEGMDKLSYMAARGAEQALISFHGLVNIQNKINSIGPKRECFDEAVEAGKALLKSIGWLP